MNAIKVVVLHEIFKDNAICLANRLGVGIADKIYEPIVYVVFGAHLNPMLLLQLQQRTNCSYVILNSEHNSSNVFNNKYYLQLLKSNYVCDYLPNNVYYLKTYHNIEVMSYFFFEFTKRVSTKPRSIDILFIGSKTDKRVEIENVFKRQNPNYNIQFIYPDKFIDISQILLNTKTVVNISYYDNNVETHRINQGLACGCKVVSYKFNQLDGLYKDHIFFTDDWIRVTSKPTKNYDELLETQINNIFTHFKWVVTVIKNIR